MIDQIKSQAFMRWLKRYSGINFSATLFLFIAISFSACSYYGPRPQTPKDRPYVVSEVLFESANSAVQLAGKLTMPYGQGPYPAVILISGSGKQDRDKALLNI